MDLFLCWIILCSTDVVRSLASIRTKLYKAQVDYVDEVIEEKSDAKRVRSKIECALVCEENADCLTFSYESSSKMCYMSSKVNNPASGKIYGPVKRCPPSFGYKLIKKGEVEICLKRVLTKLVNSAAKTACSGDGAHLISIESKNMSDFVRNYLVSKSSLSVWFDGEDINGDDRMLTWKGTEVPYVEWYTSGEPDGGDDDCLLASMLRKFRVKDVSCSLSKEYVCQIGDGIR